MKMNYITLGTNNMVKAIAFYDALFSTVNVDKWLPDGRVVVYRGDGFLFALAEPFDGNHATAGNGTMIGFEVDSFEEITELHQKALSLGGRCEGKPGPRSKGPAAYVRDLDNNKLCFFCMD
ncbi:MAG: VOC family protein [Colwellia sp.]|nr:VOC family protein [Colwellia sp.]